MWGFWKKARAKEEFSSIWKSDFSDCVAVDYLPGYSLCRNESKQACRYAVRYGGMVLCNHPDRKSFAPKDA